MTDPANFDLSDVDLAAVVGGKDGRADDPGPRHSEAAVRACSPGVGSMAFDPVRWGYSMATNLSGLSDAMLRVGLESRIAIGRCERKYDESHR